MVKNIKKKKTISSRFYSGCCWHGYHREERCNNCMYIHVRVRNGNVFKCQWNMIHYVAVRGCEMSWLSLHWLFSNKTIIFIHATDFALFTVFLTITLIPTKLKRLLTFDNFAVPSYNCPITVMHRYNVCVTESSDTLVFLFCLFISYCNWQLVVWSPSTDLPILFGVGFEEVQIFITWSLKSNQTLCFQTNLN